MDGPKMKLKQPLTTSEARSLEPVLQRQLQRLQAPRSLIAFTKFTFLRYETVIGQTCLAGSRKPHSIPASVSPESPRPGQTMDFAAVDLNAHAFASTAPMIASFTESESHRLGLRGVGFSVNVGRRSNIVITNFLSGRASVER